MTILLVAAVIVLTCVVVASAISRLHANSWLVELTAVRIEAAKAERDVHDLTREAFVAMTSRAHHKPAPVSWFEDALKAFGD